MSMMGGGMGGGGAAGGSSAQTVGGGGGSYAMMAVGGVLNILGGVTAGLAAENQIEAYKDQGRAAYRAEQRRGASVLGAQQAAEGASGFDMASPTYQAIGLDQAHLAESNALWAKYQYKAAIAQTKAARYEELFSSLNQSIQSTGGSGYQFNIGPRDQPGSNYNPGYQGYNVPVGAGNYRGPGGYGGYGGFSGWAGGDMGSGTRLTGPDYSAYA